MMKEYFLVLLERMEMPAVGIFNIKFKEERL